MLTPTEKQKLFDKTYQLLGENHDLFDTEAEIDSSLTYHENLNLLHDKLELFKANNPLVGITRANIKQQQLQQKEDNSTTLIKEWIVKSLDKSKIYAVIGGRGSGKSCFAFAFLEWHKKNNRRCYIYKFPKPSLLPDWIKNINDISQCEKGGVLLIDESGIEFNQFSFNSKQSIDLANILKTARHKDLSIIFIAQNGGNMTKDIRRMIDCYILRFPSFTQQYDEISIIKKLYLNCKMLFSTDEQKLKGFFITEIGELAYFDKPIWFSDGISKAFDGVQEGHFNVSVLFHKKKKGLNIL